MRTQVQATTWLFVSLLVAAWVPGARAACTYSSSPASRLHGSGAATNTVAVSAEVGCPWTVSNTNGWISILLGASGVGTGMVTYAVAPNPNPLERTGLVVIAGSTFTLRQSALICAYSLSPATRTHGPGLVSNSITLAANGSGCPWSASANAPWITLTASTNGLGSASVDYQVAANPTLDWRTGVVMVAGQAFTLIQRGQTCSYDLTPTTRTHGYGTASNSFSIATLSGCAWTAVSDSPWITIASGATGSASGDIGYLVAANPSGAARTGTVSVAGQVFNLVQSGQPCTYAILSPNVTHAAGPSTNSVSVTATPGCAWVVENTVSWVSILAGAGGVGDGTVTYGVTANPGPGPRSTLLSIAGQSYPIYQEEPFCTYKLSPTNRVHGPAATTNTISIGAAAGCNWTLVHTSAWVRFLSTNGSGNAGVDYILEANPGFSDRVTTVTVADQTLTLRQLGISCVPSLSPTTRTHGYGGASNSFSLAANGGCSWSAACTVPWITVVAGTNGSGNGVVSYLVDPNPSGLSRTGSIVVADAVFSLVQSGTPCGYGLTPASRNHGYGATSNSIAVSATPGCPWTVANSNAWLTVVSGASGAGDGTIGYLVAANPSTQPRSGNLVVGGQLFTIAQAGAACVPTLEPAEGIHGMSFETGLVRVTTASGCPWTVVNTNAWVALLAGAQGGTESGVVEYVLATNPNGAPRFGSLTIAGQVYPLSQGAMTCSYRLSPLSRTHGYAAASNYATLSVSNGCGWAVVNTSSWITVVSPLSGSGNATLSYTLAANSSFQGRVGTITVGGQSLVLTQQGVTCSITLSPSSRTHGSGATSNLVSITDSLGCGWTILNTNSWITFQAASGTGSVSVGYTVAANPSSLERSGVVLIGGTPYSLMQQGVSCALSLSPISRMHGYGAATNTVNLSEASGCAWSVVNTSAWVTVLSAFTGTGSAILTYAVAANPGTQPRATVLMVGDQAFSLSQAGTACSYRLSPASRTHGFLAATNYLTVNVASNCAWSIVNTNPWVTLLSPASGMGSNIVSYMVAPNLTTNLRSGTITAGDAVLSLAQRGATNGFAFEVYSIQDGSQMRVRLTGIPTGIWELQRSSDLRSWSRLGDLTNSVGVVDYLDPTPVNQEQRFYRAVLR